MIWYCPFCPWSFSSMSSCHQNELRRPERSTPVSHFSKFQTRFSHRRSQARFSWLAPVCHLKRGRSFAFILWNPSSLGCLETKSGIFNSFCASLPSKFPAKCPSALSCNLLKQRKFIENPRKLLSCSALSCHLVFRAR